MIDLPPCPNENEGSRHSWIMRAANIYAHRAIREAVYLITYKLTRAPSPYNEVDTSVRKAFAEAAEYAGRNGESIPQQQTCHTFNNSGDVDRAAKERAAKRAAWPELAAPSEQQRKSISELLVVAPEVIEALSGMDVLFCAESSEGPAIVIYATGIVRRRHRCGSTASHGRVPGNPRSSFQAANEDGPSASTRAHRPYSSQLARQGSFACSTFSGVPTWSARSQRSLCWIQQCRFRRRRRVTCSPGEKFACSSIWKHGLRVRCSSSSCPPTSKRARTFPNRHTPTLSSIPCAPARKTISS